MTIEMQVVRTTIARYCGCSTKTLEPRLRLDADLDLTPLELVLIATEIEERLGMDVPVEGLAPLETVADLMRFYRRLLVRVRRAESLSRVA